MENTPENNEQIRKDELLREFQSSLKIGHTASSKEAPLDTVDKIARWSIALFLWVGSVIYLKIKVGHMFDPFALSGVWDSCSPAIWASMLCIFSSFILSLVTVILFVKPTAPSVNFIRKFVRFSGLTLLTIFLWIALYSLTSFFAPPFLWFEGCHPW